MKMKYFFARHPLVFYQGKSLESNRSVHTVRVRFAPSPTGYLHLGGLRTALYNFLFAKKNNGRFILRIEDTDQTRLVAGASSSLIEDLNWAGISIDEGPIAGGNHGPYVQSQRMGIYNDAVKKLIATKAAYQCFCTETRLDLLRKEAIRRRQVPRYDNKCRHLTPTEVELKLKNGLQFCIRFKMDNHLDIIRDLIYGDIVINNADNEGDPVIIKTDGFPTYHFANVVDDHMMKVTHVFRGVEWQMSTPKHLHLYKAFGWEPPKFGHLPLLVNADGSKLSKRQGDINIKRFRDRGVFPLALVNYVISAGGGFPKNGDKKAEMEIQTLGSLAQKFDIERLNSHPSRLNTELLPVFNNLEIRRQLCDDNDINKIIQTVRDMVLSKYPKKDIVDLKTSYIKKILIWSSDRLSAISELTSEKFSFFWSDCDNVCTDKLTADQILDLIGSLETIEFSKKNVHQVFKVYSKRIPIKFADLMKLLRSSLCGLEDGPGVAEIMCIFGKKESIRRIRLNLKSKS